jgi:hypothetical protein
MIRLATGKFHSRFSFCRNTVTECRTIAPSSHRTQNVAILRGSVAAQNQWTLDATIHPDDETDGNSRMRTSNIKQGIGGSKCLRLGAGLTGFPVRRQSRELGTVYGRRAHPPLRRCQTAFESVVKRPGTPTVTGMPGQARAKCNGQANCGTEP